MDIQEVISAILLLIGSAFCFIAALGMNKFPDLYTRMHAATKAGAFGVALMLLALAVAMPSPRIIVMATLIIIFFYLTTPVAAQVLSRAGYYREAKPAPKTGLDELKGTPLPPAAQSDDLPSKLKTQPEAGD